MSTETSWEKVEKYFREKTNAGNMMALVEAEKLFKETVAGFDLPGDDLERQIEALNFVFTDKNDLQKTREVIKKIIEKINFSISTIEAVKNLEIYYQAIADLNEFKKKKLSFLRKIRLYLKTFLPTPKVFFKKFILVFLIFFLIIFLLDSTDFGRAIANFFVNISHLIFSWILFVLLLIAGIAILIIGTIYYFQKKQR